MNWLLDLIEPVQIWVFQELVLPLMYHTGLMAWADNAFDATGYFLLAVCQIGILYLLLRPLESWRPVEARSDGAAIRTDVLYTFLYRTGALSLLFFVLLNPLVGSVEVWLHEQGMAPPNLEDLWPTLHEQPLLAFFTYVVIIDFFEYWRHRWQHSLNWWWTLHAVHHSQRQMTLWTDDRNHVVDGLLQSLWMALVAQVIGVPGTQFVGIVFLLQAVESLSHANARMHFGPAGSRLLVSPCFHRIHHAIGAGHEGRYQGCNFATLFPLWDRLFGTADFSIQFPATGIRDQLQGADYGDGFVAQQILGVKRLWATVIRRKAGQDATSQVHSEP